MRQIPLGVRLADRAVFGSFLPAHNTEALEHLLRNVELAVGRQRTNDLSARPIDLDLLYFGEVIADFGRFEVPHPYIEQRPFNLIPLAEILSRTRSTSACVRAGDRPCTGPERRAGAVPAVWV